LNYSLKLGWTPIFCDLDLNQNEIAPPGCIAAAVVEESLPNDDLVQNSVCFFHGNLSPITLEFFDKQVDEMASAVNEKILGDLNQFQNEH
jgi:polynucleotide 5'-kinase involved in rRNA processing